MATSQLQRAVQHLRHAVRPRAGDGETDGQLLDDFIARRDEDAFAAIVHRHGPMVLGVCRRLLPRHHDAEDAFQATFLVLVRKATSVLPREMLANWLHGVAYHTALKARATTAKRQAKEKQVMEMPEPETVSPNLGDDLRCLLDQELSRLPDIYRVPIVCCDLEGKTRQEAARQLGWSEGTLSGRLFRAREMLAKRVTRRGLVLPAGSLAAVLSQEAASAVVPCSLLVSTVRAGSLVAAGQAAVTGVASVEVATLAEGVLKTMWLTKLKMTTALLVTFCAVGIGSGGVAYRMQAATPVDGPNGNVISKQAVAQDNRKTEQERLEQLLKQLEEQVRKGKAARQERLRLEKLLKELGQQIRPAQVAEQERRILEDILKQLRQAQGAEQERQILEDILKQLREADQDIRKLAAEALRRIERGPAEQEQVRAAATAAQREIDKVLEVVRKANDKKTEVEILDEIEKAVKEMKRKAESELPKKP